MNIRQTFAVLWLAAATWVGTSAGAAQPAPQIKTFTVQPVAQLAPGTELVFQLHGSPGGVVSVRVEGSPNTVTLTEARTGRYEGYYTLGSRDQVQPNSQVRATLRVNNREVTAQLGQPLLGGDARPPAQVYSSHPGATYQQCDQCGVVQSVKVVEVQGEPGYTGAIAGGVAGAVLGNQVGKGDGRTAARLLGAVGGAFAGREVEKNMSKSKRYDVTVQLHNGGVQTLRLPQDPGLRAGDQVRVVNGGVQRND